MSEHASPSPVAVDGMALAVSLTVLLRQAQSLPWESTARRLLTQATFPIRDALDALGGTTRIDLARALRLADAAVSAGLAEWAARDGFRPGPDLRARLTEIGVSVLPQLHDAEAAQLHDWIAAQAA